MSADEIPCPFHSPPGTRDPETGECNRCGRPIKGPPLTAPAAPSERAVEGQPCPTCGRDIPLSGRTRARNARERKAADTTSGTDDEAGEASGEPAGE